jgi:drug/metabolite transporter (DMT)-like permease
MKSSMLAGTIAAAMAALSWSLGFIVPFVIGAYSPFDIALLQSLFSGMLGLGLLWRRAPAVRGLRLRDWLMACSLGLIGYVGYFLAVMGAVVYAGPVIAPAFLGLVPVVLAVAGNLRERIVSWKSLAAPLLLAAVGLLLVNGSGFLQSNTPSQPQPLGMLLALLAVTLWTTFGLLNQSALAMRPEMDPTVWTALIMVGAGLAMLVFLPIGLSLGVFEFPKLGLRWEGAESLIVWAALLAIFSNVGGAIGWTYASQRLPVALSAQLITLEPASATVLGLLIHRRWPSAAESAGMILLLVGVIIAIGVFARAAAGSTKVALA